MSSRAPDPNTDQSTNPPVDYRELELPIPCAPVFKLRETLELGLAGARVLDLTGPQIRALLVFCMCHWPYADGDFTLRDLIANDTPDGVALDADTSGSTQEALVCLCVGMRVQGDSPVVTLTGNEIDRFDTGE